MTLQRRITSNLRSKGVAVRTRREWGTKHALVYARRLVTHRHAPFPSDTAVQHITVTHDSGRLVGDFKTDMQTIERIGYERFQSGISYNFVVDMHTGMIGVGMPLKAKGTHTVNEKGVSGFSYDQNLVAIGIAVMGMCDTPLSDKAEASLGKLLAALIEEGALTPGHDYVPHNLFTAKDCPCPPTQNRMRAINEQARTLAAAHLRRRNR